MDGLCDRGRHRVIQLHLSSGRDVATEKVLEDFRDQSGFKIKGGTMYTLDPLP